MTSTEFVVCRTVIIDYTDKTRCVTLLGSTDKGYLQCWEHEHTTDDDIGVVTGGFRTFDPDKMTILGVGFPLPVPMSALVPVEAP